MLPQVQSLLVTLQVVQMIHLATSSMLPMELYEIAHSHHGIGDHSSAAPSLHDLLVAEGHFEERKHPMTRALTIGDDPLIVHDPPQTGRRHRKSANHASRRNGRQYRQGRQIVSQQHENSNAAALSVEPKIYYAVGSTSEADLPICAPNAVCSKIDVYDADVPFIERQCVCPQQSIIYQYSTDSRTASLQKHLENVQRNRPQRILDLNYNVRVPVEEAYLKELMRKLRTAYDVPEIILEGRDSMDSLHGGRLLRKRQKIVPATGDLDNVIRDRVFGSGSTGGSKKRHNHRDVPKIGGCSALVGRGDGHTIVDKTRQYKVCEHVSRLPECENFGYTWSVKTNVQTNMTQQIVHCRCKKNSVTYLSKREPLPNNQGYEFLFACAPQNEIRCQRKEPCKLFSVRKRDEVQEVNTHPLCKCPREHSCPKHHTEAGVIGSTNYSKDKVMTYTAYCMADES